MIEVTYIINGKPKAYKFGIREVKPPPVEPIVEKPETNLDAKTFIVAVLALFLSILSLLK